MPWRSSALRATAEMLTLGESDPFFYIALWQQKRRR